MAFLIPDNLRSRKDVTGPVQRVATAFQTALDDDVTVWFEPLFNHERPHFIVLDPNLGVIVLQLISLAGDAKVLGAVRGTLRVEAGGREAEVPDPLAAAEEFVARLRAQFAGERPEITVPLGALAVLASERRADAPAKRLDTLLDLSRCVFRDDLDAAIKDDNPAPLLRCFRAGMPTTLDAPLSDAEIDRVRAVIHPEVVVKAQVEQQSLFVVDAETDVMRVMDRKQEALAKSLGTGHRVLRGVAGSGKTLVLVHRARLLARLLPNQRILVTCFNRALASQLRAQLDDYDNVEVVHLDRLMGRIMRDAGVKHPGYDSGSDPVSKAALEAIQKLKTPRYRAVLVDEAQDFDTSALQFCVELLEATDTKAQDLVIVADSAQNIYRRSFRWKDAGIEAQGRTRILRTNYRNTREILEFAHRFLIADPTVTVDESPDAEDGITIIPPESALRSGPGPEVLVRPDPEAEIEAVVDHVGKAYATGMRSRSIAVLHGDGLPRLESRIVQRLRDAGIPVFWVTDPDEKQNRDHAGDAHEPVIVSTIYSAKGLEYPHVIACGLAPLGGQPSAQRTLASRKLAYVGFTRAINRLTVVTRTGTEFTNELLDAAADT